MDARRYEKMKSTTAEVSRCLWKSDNKDGVMDLPNERKKKFGPQGVLDFRFKKDLCFFNATGRFKEIT